MTRSRTDPKAVLLHLTGWLAERRGAVTQTVEFRDDLTMIENLRRLHADLPGMIEEIEDQCRSMSS